MIDFLDRALVWLVANDVTASEAILNALIGMVLVGVLVSLWRLHGAKGIYQNFNLVHLIVNKDGFPDGAKVFEVGAFMLMAWGFVAQVTAKTLEEWYVTVFVGAFVLRGMYGAHLRSKAKPEAEGISTETDTHIKTREVEMKEQRP